MKAPGALKCHNSSLLLDSSGCDHGLTQSSRSISEAEKYGVSAPEIEARGSATGSGELKLPR